MMKFGDLKPCDIPLRQKIIYEGYMQMNKNYPDPFAKSEIGKEESQPPKSPGENTDYVND